MDLYGTIDTDIAKRPDGRSHTRRTALYARKQPNKSALILAGMHRDRSATPDHAQRQEG
jgi:hypothetical protein